MADYLQQMRDKVKVGENVFIAPNATLVGDISLADNVSVWFGAVLRADFDKIVVDENTNIQDNAIFHVEHDVPVHVGKGNIIGHGAIVHGCDVGDHNLIGMRATVMNNARIGNYCVIGAHALVTENMEVPDFSMVLGTPGRVVKTLPGEVIERLKWGADVYKQEAHKYLNNHQG
ncbi:MAG: gamma carbonic anhydrase family protein [Bacteroidetes bacterium SW_11_45_7]|nr:MAG: gamma carbonic anhydrase family protein [Bacteroidetes bacterium SW_11_45_7]